MYAISNRDKGQYMLPEEGQVYEALKGYKFDPADNLPTDFCPTHVLYATYLRYMRDYAPVGESVAILNLQQFGVAFRRVFDIDADRKTRRTYQGRNVPGYTFVNGPGSRTTNASRGNPRLQHARPENSTAASEVECRTCGVFGCTEHSTRAPTPA